MTDLSIQGVLGRIHSFAMFKIELAICKSLLNSHDRRVLKSQEVKCFVKDILIYFALGKMLMCLGRRKVRCDPRVIPLFIY